MSYAGSASVGNPISSPTSLSGEVLDGAWLTRAINSNRDELSAMEEAAQQLDSIINFASTKSKINKELKQALIQLRRFIMAVRQDHEKLVATAATADPAKSKVTMSTQMEAFAFAGSPKSVADAIAYDKQSQKRALV